MSNNIFTKNIGCYDTTGTILAMCGQENQLYENYNNPRLYASPNTYPVNADWFDIDDNITSFSTVVNVTLNDGEVTIDRNKFMMTNNIFTQNYAPNYLGIVNIDVYKISIDNDTYSKNTFQYKEAINKYGAILVGEDASDGFSGAYDFREYYSANGDVYLSKETKGNYMYPGPPLLIRSSAFIDVGTITFDNNYFAETATSDVLLNIGAQAQAIGLQYCGGIVQFNKFIIMNHGGVDVNEVASIIGDEKAAYILTATPDLRDILSGEYLYYVDDPYYFTDYGFKTSVITFYTPYRESESDMKNSFTSIQFEEIHMYNMSYYSPVNPKTMLMNLDDSVKNVEIDYLNVTLVDCYA